MPVKESGIARECRKGDVAEGGLGAEPCFVSQARFEDKFNFSPCNYPNNSLSSPSLYTVRNCELVSGLLLNSIHCSRGDEVAYSKPSSTVTEPPDQHEHQYVLTFLRGYAVC